MGAIMRFWGDAGVFLICTVLAAASSGTLDGVLAHEPRVASHQASLWPEAAGVGRLLRLSPFSSMAACCETCHNSACTESKRPFCAYLVASVHCIYSDPRTLLHAPDC